MNIAENMARRQRWLAEIDAATALARDDRLDESIARLDALEAEVDEALRALGIDPTQVVPA